MHEEICLGTGGPIHRFKKEIGEEKILVSNGDQFYFDAVLRNWYDTSGTTLFGIRVHGTYSTKFIVEGDTLISIEPARSNEAYTPSLG